MTFRTRKAALALLPATLALMTPAVFAQTSTMTAPGTMNHGRHLNAIQRHPMLTSIAAAAATHHALKVAARNRKMHGQKLDFAQRHPTMSALGAGAIVHHEIKAHTPH